MMRAQLLCTRRRRAGCFGTTTSQRRICFSACCTAMTTPLRLWKPSVSLWLMPVSSLRLLGAADGESREDISRSRPGRNTRWSCHCGCHSGWAATTSGSRICCAGFSRPPTDRGFRSYVLSMSIWTPWCRSPTRLPGGLPVAVRSVKRRQPATGSYWPLRALGSSASWRPRSWLHRRLGRPVSVVAWLTRLNGMAATKRVVTPIDAPAAWAHCSRRPPRSSRQASPLGALPPVTSVCWTARHLGWDGAWPLRDRDAHGQHSVVISGVHVLGVHGLTED